MSENRRGDFLTNILGTSSTNAIAILPYAYFSHKRTYTLRVGLLPGREHSYGLTGNAELLGIVGNWRTLATDDLSGDRCIPGAHRTLS